MMSLARLLVVMAVLLGLAAPFAGPADAHEVRPAIADLTLGAERTELVIRLNVEALVAEIDLEGLADTNEAANAQDYDRLRLLQPEDLATAFRDFWPRMRAKLSMSVAGDAATPALADITVAPVGDPDVPRDTVLTLRAPGGGPVVFQWDASFGDIILRQQGIPADKAFTGMLRGGEASPPISSAGAASEGGLDTFLRYIGVGFEHIVPLGLDHILFVLGLFFLSPRLRPLLWQVSAFTLAHTVTLALGALGLVVVDPAIVEPLIAASIVYVAVENVITRDLARWRPILIFGFGLLHGLGFASVLGEYGLPEAQFIPALVGFNIGVELGQLAVIGAAFLAVGLWFRARHWYRAGIAIPASCMIAAVGAFWVLDRTVL